MLTSTGNHPCTPGSGRPRWINVSKEALGPLVDSCFRLVRFFLLVYFFSFICVRIDDLQCFTDHAWTLLFVFYSCFIPYTFSPACLSLWAAQKEGVGIQSSNWMGDLSAVASVRVGILSARRRCIVTHALAYLSANCWGTVSQRTIGWLPSPNENGWRSADASEYNQPN